MEFADRRLLMTLSFSDREIEVRLADNETDAGDLYVREIGKPLVSTHADLATAVSLATSLPMDLVHRELGRAFPSAAERSGGSSGELHLRTATSRTDQGLGSATT